MAVILIKIVPLLFLIKHVVLEKGYVNEVTMSMKAQCVGSSKKVFTVKSEIQCTHQCLRKRCNLLNYNMKNGERNNCEVLKEVGKCSELSNQGGWKMMTFVMEILYKVQLDVVICSYGTLDSDCCTKKVIKVNGIDTGAAGRGFNVVVISPSNGTILGVGNFNTQDQHNASSAMITFINNYPDGSILIIAITDNAERKLTPDAKDYLSWLGSNNILNVTRRSSFALLTAKGVPKPVWFAEKFATKGNGPSIIKTTIRI